MPALRSSTSRASTSAYSTEAAWVSMTVTPAPCTFETALRATSHTSLIWDETCSETMRSHPCSARAWYTVKKSTSDGE